MFSVQLSGPSRTSGGITMDKTTVEAAERSARKVVGQVDVQSVQAAIAIYQEKNGGKLPPDLETLRAEGLLDKIPAGISYDSQTGQVSAGQ